MQATPEVDAGPGCGAGLTLSLSAKPARPLTRSCAQVTRYSVDVSASRPGDAVRAAFSCTRDLLFVLMPREARRMRGHPGCREPSWSCFSAPCWPQPAAACMACMRVSLSSRRCPGMYAASCVEGRPCLAVRALQHCIWSLAIFLDWPGMTRIPGPLPVWRARQSAEHTRRPAPTPSRRRGFAHAQQGRGMAAGRQVIVFDLEFGQPAASTALPKTRPAFSGMLGCFGHRGAGRGLHGGGVDILYLSHQARPGGHCSRRPASGRHARLRYCTRRRARRPAPERTARARRTAACRSGGGGRARSRTTCWACTAWCRRPRAARAQPRRCCWRARPARGSAAAPWRSRRRSWRPPAPALARRARRLLPRRATRRRARPRCR